MPEDKNSHTLNTIKAYGKSLLAFIRKRVKNDADAEDILQDVWYQFSAVVNAEPIAETGAWLYKVARNKITDKHKKKSESLLSDLFGSDDEDDESVTQDLESILLPDTNTPENAYMNQLVWDEVFAALDELPEEQKQVFIWHELDDMSFAEMTDLTGVPIQTLVSRKRYAVLHLRKRLKVLYDEIIKS
ncbi:sigma-70 family RNA polymerase sigma factor [Mucilaginibacter sp. R11]|uniref:Sigma-70 family RNA polymerase sigma factor n=2 Tax=Mucilaginibacter agri TaxID=2695265 RepID=A0A966DR62_9SPHI|nr:sigma-70 family RNA polymerase sigma factor [Mucilaginibacter agri]